MSERPKDCAHESRLWTIRTKLLALAELIKYQGGEPPINAEEINYGTGALIESIAEELRIVQIGSGATEQEQD